MLRFIVSDTHFGHKEIISYTNRPFCCADEMDEKLIENWNATVTHKKHIVYHLGDVGCRNVNRLTEILRKLNGKIYLIKGNHDVHNTPYYLKAGFSGVYETPIILDKDFILSHKPMSAPSPYFNIHGHTHEKESPTERHFNASVERIDYSPIPLEEIELLLIKKTKLTKYQ